ncbi:MAG: protein kinase [Deltaproteobacteria bacterium]|nr:protein kinase [Deltaproteobacteria bacterium]
MEEGKINGLGYTFSGKWINKQEYHILDAIGEDGRGPAFKVEKTQKPDEIYAVKMTRLSPDDSAPHQIKMIEKKLEALSTMNSDHLVIPLDWFVEETEYAKFFCVITDYFEKGSIADKYNFHAADGHIVNDVVPGEELKGLLLQICDGLATLHGHMDTDGNSNAIIHGDLKPQDLLIGDDGKIKLAVPALIEFHGNDLSPGMDNDILMAPVWVAPEQIVRHTGSIGTWTDIWSLGVMMYQFMRGEHPYKGKTVENTIANITIDGVSRKRIEGLPATLNRILDGCLRKSCDQRIRTVEKLARDIQEAEFVKRCSNDHMNEYNALVCVHPGCGLTFVQEDDINWVVHNKWLRHTPLPQSLAINESQQFYLKVTPSRHPDYEKKLKRTGLIFNVVFKDCEKPLTVELLPVPRFDATPGLIEVEFDPENQFADFQVNLELLNSKAVIEKIEASLDELPTADVQVKTPVEHITLDRATGPVPVQMSINIEHLKENQPYNLTLLLYLKNLKKPLLVNTYFLDHEFKLQMINPPRLVVFPQRGSIHIRLYQQNDSVGKFLSVMNGGGGKLRIREVEAVAESCSDSEVDFSAVIEFDQVDPDDIIDGGSGSPIALKYTIHPIDNWHTNQDGANDQELIDMNFNLIFKYDVFRDSRWHPKELVRHLTITLLPHEEGYVCAIDFGTTNSYCVAYRSVADRSKPLELDLYNNPKDRVIPSVIQYFFKNKDIAIGRQPSYNLIAGEPNAFCSLKSQVGNRKKSELVFLPEGGTKRIKVEKMIADYLKLLISQASAKLGLTFPVYVFSHPSKLTLPKVQAFRRILKTAGIDRSRYSLIDEATAAALHHIYQNQGAYRLLVYDFGGGTIDITYLQVIHNELSNFIKVEVLDVDGMQDFGGDDVTREIRNIVIGSFEKNENMPLLPPEPGCRTVTVHERQAGSNARILMGRCEQIKTDELFSPEKEQKEVTTTFLLQYENPLNGLIEERRSAPVSIRRSEIRRCIFTRIEDSVSIIQTMFDLDDNDSETESSPCHILLSGRSSKIPLVKQMFKAFKDGKHPMWSEEEQDVVFVDDPTVTSKLQYDRLIFADRPKAGVALGAALYRSEEIAGIQTGEQKIDIRSISGKNWWRIGTTKSVGGSKTRFVEWIARNRRFVSTEAFEKSKVIDPQTYAAAEKEWNFKFDDDGRMLWKIVVYEHTGRDDEHSDIKCVEVGRYDVSRPDCCDEKHVQGIIRMAITKDFELRLRVQIYGVWIDAKRHG